MDKASLKFVFGEVAEYSLEVYRRIRQEICNNKYQYIFYSNEGFISEALKNGPGWTNQYYCMEILQRIYLASLTGYFRQQKWLDGVCSGVSTNNYILFCSSIRGFLEAATDYYDALECIPLTLAENFKLMSKAVKGEITDSIIGFEELENILLHFQEASRQSQEAGRIYSPKSAKAYMESKNLKSLNLYECYGDLCEVTHPANSSLNLFLNADDYIYTFADQDTKLMQSFVDKYSKPLSDLYMRVENICVITLQVLNLFQIEMYYSQAAASLNTENLKIWDKIHRLIK